MSQLKEAPGRRRSRAQKLAQHGQIVNGTRFVANNLLIEQDSRLLLAPAGGAPQDPTDLQLSRLELQLFSNRPIGGMGSMTALSMARPGGGGP